MVKKTRPVDTLSSAFRQRVYDIVRLVPYAKVTTYGHVALLCGVPRRARHVGWALHSLPSPLVWGAEEDARYLTREGQARGKGAGAGAVRPAPVPWHRVINAQGRVSTHPEEYGTRRQVELLREEGIEVTDDGTLVQGLGAHQWEPEPAVVEGLELPPEVLFAIDQEGPFGRQGRARGRR